MFIHEIAHAFHDDLVLRFPHFEEGMARAIEVEVMDQLPSYDYWDRHHSYQYDVYADALDDHRIAATPAAFTSGPLSLLRYQLAGYAWGKVLIERPGFLAAFNAKLYSDALVDPWVVTDEAKLVANGARQAPLVEGRPFSQWYYTRGVFQNPPPTGDFVYQRTSQQTFDVFSRGDAGEETPYGGVPVSWEARDAAGVLLASQSTYTEPMGFQFMWASIPDCYEGRVQYTVTAELPGGATVTDTQITTARQRRGAFGAVPPDIVGTVTITPTAPAGPPVSAPIVEGAFEAASLATARGTFRADFTRSDGSTSWKVFTKDASDYYLALE